MQINKARDLVAELVKRKLAGTLTADDPYFKGDFTPLPPRDIDLAEKELGFLLTPLLRRIFSEVSNGGFGPSYGMLGLRGGMQNEDGGDAVTLYSGLRQTDPNDSYWMWPVGLLPLGHLGCAMYLCIDCTKPEGPVVWFEPNPHEIGKSWSDSFFPLADSTEAWLFAWLDGEDLFEKMCANS